MGRRKKCIDIRVYDNCHNGKVLPEKYRIFLKDFNGIAQLFSAKLIERNFSVAKFPLIYFLLDADIPESPAMKTYPHVLLKEALEVIVGFPITCLDENNQTAMFASFIGRHLRNLAPLLDADYEVLKEVEDLVVANGFNLEIVLLEKKSPQYQIKVFFKFCRLELAPEESCVIPQPKNDYTPGARIFLESVDRITNRKQIRLLFETSPLLVYAMFARAVIKDDEVQFVPKSTASAKISLRDEQYPTVVKIFED